MGEWTVGSDRKAPTVVSDSLPREAEKRGHIPQFFVLSQAWGEAEFRRL